MSCGNDKHSDDCVCSTLLAIAEAQEKIEEDSHTGCKRSIEELKGRIKPKGFDTIPVLLTIDGHPFSAVGAVRTTKPDHRLFNIFKSFLFRVNTVNRSTCCATLELLKPANSHPHYQDSSSSSSSSQKFEESSSSSSSKHDYPMYFEFNNFLSLLDRSDKIVRTGVYVTVDLKDFTSVSCFPAVLTK